jgi:hypothetical protein
MVKPCIRFDSSHTLFFNTLMNLISIRVFIENISERDQKRIERVAIRQEFLFDKDDQAATLEILGRLPNLNVVKIVSEIPGDQDGEQCLGPRELPVEAVDFYTPTAGPSTPPYWSSGKIHSQAKRC